MSYKGSSVVAQPAEDRLDDLLWEFERYRRAELAPEPIRLESVRSEIIRIGKMIYGEQGYSIEDFLTARTVICNIHVSPCK